MDSVEILKLYRDITNDEIKTSFKTQKEVIHYNLELKYLTSREYYNTKIINDVIYNENTHIVSVFKDYLIYDDVSEFLKRHYDQQESKKRLPKVIEFYETYSKVFPNYVNLPENKFMFKNIERKQLYWDSKQHFLMEQEERNAKKRARIEDFGGVQNAPSSFFDETIEDKMFSGSFINSVEMMKTLQNNQESFLKIVNIKNEQDSYVHKDGTSASSKKKSIASQFETLIKKYTEKENSSIYSKSEVDFSQFSKLNQNESFLNVIEKETEISDFFKKSTKRMKEVEQQK